ncbi:hypothetical protein BpHYR1_025455 [Brachionus plicatilis]|uniref:Uncharacterized protein n=1 Tax=Brachionus plicatilis TaxID=10195 RepID=A0A3M7PZL2_BRAPC|nr:hypothetical protein BpHYR1_025455 [Brachionus plicatilis]
MYKHLFIKIIGFYKYIKRVLNSFANYLPQNSEHVLARQNFGFSIFNILFFCTKINNANMLDKIY